MNIEILSIGDELLLGTRQNTNTTWLAQQIFNSGANGVRFVSIGDNIDMILDALESSSSADMVIVTGGLGPTSDDITKDAICKWLPTTLSENPDVLRDITLFFRKRNLPLSETNRKQALVPKGAKILKNLYGTAPGLVIEKGKTRYIFLPGVPFEMESIVMSEVIPLIRSINQGEEGVYDEVIFIGIGESFLADKLSKWEEMIPESIKISYLPSPGFVRLRLTSTNSTTGIHGHLEQYLKKAIQILPENGIYTGKESLNNWFVKYLADHGFTLGIAESCTGGFLSHYITQVPGSSEVFKGSMVVYGNESKIMHAKVPIELIEKEGAVSKLVVETLAKNTRRLYKTDIGIAISGVAGPGGGTVDKPVGIVWIAVETTDKLISQKYSFGNVRLSNIKKAAIMAILMTIKSTNIHNQVS